MKAAVAFTVGLWTGALAIGAVSLFYFYWWNHSRVNTVPATPDQTEIRLQLLQQQDAQATAEVQRLRETVADLESQLAGQAASPLPGVANPAQHTIRRIPYRANAGAGAVAPWILRSLIETDLPKLEQGALQNDLNALDAVALLADRDNAETLTRIWAADSLNAGAKDHATMLIAATVELNPHGEELLQPLATNVPASESLLPAALTGLETPGFPTRLTVNTGMPPPPHFRPDYALRLRILDNWRAVVTNEILSAAIERVRSNLTQRISETEAASQ